MNALVRYEEPLTNKEIEKYNNVTKLFFKHLDSNNTQRLIQEINNLTGN